MMANNQEQLSFYRKMAELQDKLRKSEDERAGLESKFQILVKQSRAEEEARLAALRHKYARFLEEEKRRKSRNDKIITALDKIEKHTAVLTAKTERLKLLRRHFDAYMSRTYPSWRDRIKKSSETQESPDYVPQQTPGFILQYPKQEIYIPKYKSPPPAPKALDLTKESEHFKSLMKEKYRIPQFDTEYASYRDKPTATRQELENLRRSFNDLATPLTDSALEHTEFNTSRDLLSVTFDDDPLSDNKENKVPSHVAFKNDSNIPKLNLDNSTKKVDTSEDEDVMIKKLTKISSFDDEKEDFDLANRPGTFNNDFDPSIRPGTSMDISNNDFDPSIRPGTSMGTFNNDFDPSIQPGTSMGTFNDELSDEAPEPLHKLVPQDLGYHHNDMIKATPHFLNNFHDTQKEKIVEEHVPEETVQEFSILPEELETEKGSNEINEFENADFSKISESDKQISDVESSEGVISYAKSDAEQFLDDQERYEDKNGTILEEDEEISRETYEDQSYQSQNQGQFEQNQNDQQNDAEYDQDGQNFQAQDPEKSQFVDPNYQQQQGYQQNDPQYQQIDPQYQQTDPQTQQVYDQIDQQPQQKYDENDPRYQQIDPQNQQQAYDQNDPQYQQQVYDQNDPQYQQSNQQYQLNDPQYQQNDPQYQQNDPQYQQNDPQYQQNDPQYQQNDPQYQQNDPQYQNDPQFQQNDPQYQQNDPQYQQNDPQFQQNDTQYQQNDPQYQQSYDQNDPQYQQNDPQYQQNDPQYQQNDTQFQQNDPEYQQNDPQFQQNDPQYQQNDTQYQQNGPQYQQNDPQYQQNDPQYQQNEPQLEGQGEHGQAMYQEEQLSSAPVEIQAAKSNEGFREMELNMPVSDRGDTDTLAELDSSDLTTTSDLKPLEEAADPVSEMASSSDEIERQMAALVTSQEAPPPAKPVPEPVTTPVKTPSTKSSPSSSRPTSKTSSRPSSGTARSKPPSPAAKKSPTTRSPAAKKP